MPNPGLQGLHEILLPDPVSRLPQTAGWYVLFGVVLLGLLAWAYAGLRRFRADRYRRLALAELGGLEREFAASRDRSRVLPQIAVLLKRTALSAYARTDVAGLSGESWLAFLDRTAGCRVFSEGPGRLFGEIAYVTAARIEQIPEEGIADLFRFARGWIRKHGNFSRQGGSGPSQARQPGNACAPGPGPAAAGHRETEMNPNGSRT